MAEFHNRESLASLGPSARTVGHQQCRVGILRGMNFCGRRPTLLPCRGCRPGPHQLVRSHSPPPRGHRAPRIQSFRQIEFVELEVAVTIRRPEVLVRGHVDVIRRVGRRRDTLIEELAILSKT